MCRSCRAASPSSFRNESPTSAVGDWPRSRLRFSGTVANDIVAELDLPIRLGAQVAVRVADVDAPPMVASSTEDEVSGLLSKTWSKSDFEQFALARGFL